MLNNKYLLDKDDIKYIMNTVFTKRFTTLHTSFSYHLLLCASVHVHTLLRIEAFTNSILCFTHLGQCCNIFLLEMKSTHSPMMIQFYNREFVICYSLISKNLLLKNHIWNLMDKNLLLFSHQIIILCGGDNYYTQHFCFLWKYQLIDSKDLYEVLFLNLMMTIVKTKGLLIFW